MNGRGTYSALITAQSYGSLRFSARGSLSSGISGEFSAEYTLRERFANAGVGAAAAGKRMPRRKRLLSRPEPSPEPFSTLPEPASRKFGST